MDDKVKEQISALVDGELSEAESELLLARLARDAELRITWERYQLAGEVLRNQAARFYDPRFCSRVMDAIQGENVPAEGSGSTRTPAWIRTGASLAIAASVAVVAVLLLQSGPASQGEQGSSSVTLARSVPEHDFRRIDAGAPRLAETDRAPSRELVENLSQYVVNHNEFAARTGLPHLARQVSAVETGRVEVK